MKKLHREKKKFLTPAQVIKGLGGHKAKATGCEEAWWYENKGSIDVYMRCGNRQPGNVLYCQISKRAIKGWLARLEK